jgi:hypothetical protein
VYLSLAVLEHPSALAFFVAFYVMWKQFTVVRVGNTLDMNFDTLLAEFQAEVIALNASGCIRNATALP